MQNINKTLDKINDLYTTNLKNHGVDSKSVGWKDEDGQNLRFENLLKIIKEDNRHLENQILDYGCGYGAMYSYMKLHNINVSKFYGYDISQEMLRKASEIIPTDRFVPRLSSDINDEVDYSIVSGSFNVMFDSSAEEWDLFIKKTVTRLFEVSRKGIAFNLLTSYVDWKAPDLYYADPSVYFDFCKRNLSRHVSLIHDYPLYEWTILVRKI